MTLDLKSDQNSKPGIQLLIMCPRTGGTTILLSCVFIMKLFSLLFCPKCGNLIQPACAHRCTNKGHYERQIFIKSFIVLSQYFIQSSKKVSVNNPFLCYWVIKTRINVPSKLRVYTAGTVSAHRQKSNLN